MKARPSTTTTGALALRRLEERLPPLGDVAKRAFRKAFPDAYCDALGARTKSLSVFEEGVAWATQIDRVLLTGHPELRYGPDRLAWLVHCLLELHEARAAHGPKGADGFARASAIELRAGLVRKLTELAGKVDAEQQALAAVVGTEAELAASLIALAGHAGGWLDRSDPEDQILVADARLSQIDVQGALAAVRALEGGAPDGPSHDAQPVDRAEGRVIEEMRLAHERFAEAHGKNPAIEPLTPGAGTRGVLAGRPAPKAAKRTARAPAAKKRGAAKGRARR